MKAYVIISLIFHSWFLYSQQETKVFLYIQKQLYKKPYTVYDSISHQSLLNNFYNKYKPNIILDSVKQKDIQLHYYYSFLPKKINAIITDTQSNIVFKKRISNKFLPKYFSNIIKQYENKGYPFAFINLDSISFTSNILFAWYTLNQHSHFTYDSIDIIGKLLVSKTFLQSYLNIKPGKEYKEKDIQQIDKHLTSLPFYKLSKTSEIFFINNRAKPRIFLEKNNSNQFYGIVGFGTLANQKLVFNGELQVQLNNLLKHADSWQIQWKKTDALSQNLYFEGNLPYILSNPIGLSGLFNMKKQDSSYINLRYNIGLNFYIQGFNGLSLFVERRQTNIFQLSQSGIAPINSTLGGISFSHKYVNQLLLPTNGYGVHFSLAYGRKQLQKNNLDKTIVEKFENENQTLLGTLHSFAYLPIGRLLLYKFVADVGYMNVAHFRNELFRNGGSKSIRGFDEESIYSKSYIIGTIEQRFIIDRNTQLLAFIDKMYYESLSKNFDDPWSIGVGAEINTTAGLFFISYALGSQLNQPINFRTGKIHFGYKNNF